MFILSIIHRILYALCAAVSLAHVVFGTIDVINAHFTSGIFPVVVAAIATVYFTLHLVLRHVHPNTRFIHCIWDQSALSVLCVLTTVAKFVADWTTGYRYEKPMAVYLTNWGQFALIWFTLVFHVCTVVTYVRHGRADRSMYGWTSFDRLVLQKKPEPSGYSRV